MKKMDEIMSTMRGNPPKEIASSPVSEVLDYQLSTATSAAGVSTIDLPKSNVLEYRLENGCTAIVRPSGTEPKIKLYLSLVGSGEAEIGARSEAIGSSMKQLLGV